MKTLQAHIETTLTAHARILIELTGKVQHSRMSKFTASLVNEIRKETGIDATQEAKQALFNVENCFLITVD